MARKKQSSNPSDPILETVQHFLDRYESENPGSVGKCYRQSSVSVRIRIVDPRFQGMNLVERDQYVRKYLDELPDEVYEDLPIPLLLTENELRTSFANMDFEHPIPSSL